MFCLKLKCIYEFGNRYSVVYEFTVWNELKDSV